MGQSYGKQQEMAKHSGVGTTEELLIELGQNGGPGRSCALGKGLPGQSGGLKLKNTTAEPKPCME